MKNLFVKSAFMIGAILLINTFTTLAETGPVNNPNGDPPFNDDGKNGLGPKNSVPIDGGASILLAAGAAYGLKKLRDSRKRNSMAETAA